MAHGTRVDGPVEIIDEWHHYDGFLIGIVRIDGLLCYAHCVSDMMSEDDNGPWEYRARSLFHLLWPLVEFDDAVDRADPDPGLLTFSETQLIGPEERVGSM